MSRNIESTEANKIITISVNGAEYCKVAISDNQTRRLRAGQISLALAKYFDHYDRNADEAYDRVGLLRKGVAQLFSLWTSNIQHHEHAIYYGPHCIERLTDESGYLLTVGNQEYTSQFLEKLEVLLFMWLIEHNDLGSSDMAFNVARNLASNQFHQDLWNFVEDVRPDIHKLLQGEHPSIEDKTTYCLDLLTTTVGQYAALHGILLPTKCDAYSAKLGTGFSEKCIALIDEVITLECYCSIYGVVDKQKIALQIEQWYLEESK